MDSLSTLRERARACFPSLASGFAYLDNAGGSQIPAVAIDAMAEYCRSSYAQSGGGYRASLETRRVLDAAHAFAAEFLNAGNTGGVILGPSSTSLVHLLSTALGEVLEPGDEIIVADTNHEANATPWYRLERFGLKIVPWPVDPETFTCTLSSLAGLLNSRTRVVAFPHASNVTGMIADVRAICDSARAAGAISVCDGVAFAPHRAVDVQALGCDFYFYSAYKVYGPHLAAMFGRHQAWARLTGPNHVFIANNSFPTKWELGSLSYEGCAALGALPRYLEILTGEPYAGRETIERAFAAMRRLEEAPHERLYHFLAGKSRVRIVGPRAFGADAVGTLSFRAEKLLPAEIAAQVDPHPIGIKASHFYSIRLLRGLGLRPEEGVLRVSLVHYNTVGEIERLQAVLDPLL